MPRRVDGRRVSAHDPRVAVEPTEDEISKPGRNDPCHCGSGKKYKKCHLASDASERSAAEATARAEKAARLEAERAEAEAAEEAEEAEAEASGKEAAGKKAATKKAFDKAAKRGGKPAVAAPTARQIRRRGVS